MGATIETLAFGFGLIEGPRIDALGNLYFSDVRKGGVFRRSPEGSIETLVPRRRGVGGIALHADGGLVISGRNVCWVRDGQTRVLLERDDIPGFNDLVADPEGRIYVGSMRSDPFSGEGMRTPGECYRIELDGEVRELYGGVELSNGIGLSPRGDRLYHSDTSPRCIWVHDLDPQGRLHDRRVFATLDAGAPDGLAVDREGGVWVADVSGGGVQRFTPKGRLDRKLAFPSDFVTSLCFGGNDGRDLYVVTASNLEDPARGGTIFRTRSEFAGLPASFARV
ncbi:MAG: SMP-30/gluconolactonase/LRE family protein [Myxococcota bacterium]